MNELGLKLATQYLRSADAPGLLRLTDVLLPTLIAALSPQERAQFLKAVIQNHLETLLHGISSGERAALWVELSPALNAAFAPDTRASSERQPPLPAK